MEKTHSRRTFLRQSGKLIGGSWVAAHLPLILAASKVAMARQADGASWQHLTESQAATLSMVADQVEYAYLSGVTVSRKISPYITADLKIYMSRKNIFGCSSDVYLSVKNITDEDYEAGSGPLPGRSITAGLNGRF